MTFEINTHNQWIHVDVVVVEIFNEIFHNLRSALMTPEAMALDSWRSTEQYDFLFKPWPAIMKYDKRMLGTSWKKDKNAGLFTKDDLEAYVQALDACIDHVEQRGLLDHSRYSSIEELRRSMTSAKCKLQRTIELESRYTATISIHELKEQILDAVDQLDMEDDRDKFHLTELKNHLTILLSFIDYGEEQEHLILPKGLLERIISKIEKSYELLTAADKIQAIVIRIILALKSLL